MANTIKLKRKSDADGAPTTGDLVAGELALNTFSGRVFLEKSDGGAAIVELIHDQGGQTIGGDLTITGAFTSLGIDDNATKEVVQITDNGINLGDGTAAETYLLSIRDVTTGRLTISGGSGTTNGANIALFGETAAGTPGDTQFKTGSVAWQTFDESAGEWTLSTNVKASRADAITVPSSGVVRLNQTLRMTERADHLETPTATFGELWVRSDAPNVLVFTDDAGTDWDLNTAGGGGDVTKVGTPVNNQIGIWTGDGTIEGVIGLTFDGTLRASGDIDAFGDVYLGGNNNRFTGVDTTMVAHRGTNTLSSGIQLQDSTATVFGSLFSTESGGTRIGFYDAGGSWSYEAFNDGDHVWSTDGAAEIMRINRLASGDGVLELTGSLAIDERADHGLTPAAGIGELWVRNDAPNVLVFTDDTGTDWDLNIVGGSPAIDGDVLTYVAANSRYEAVAPAAGGTPAITSTASATLTLDDTHDTVVGTLSGTQTFTLPTASGIAGKIYIIKNTSASGTLTVQGTGSPIETIDGASSFLLTVQYQSVTVQSDGTNWIVI